ncbi:MAG: peptidoglycan-associated lipoprotein Pal [Deltaproteobacteria bacterium]|nr:peptidoglycan-associated lipoprotein Pal [Deltaproteobacteria bacterium]
MKNLKVAVAVLALSIVAAGCAKQETKKTEAAKLQSVYFDFDRSDIKPEYQAALKGNATWINNNSKSKVEVQGNCDERGTSEYNLALGDRRAKSAQGYLVNLGVDRSKLSTVSFGKEKPSCTEHNESCWWKNRRDDFVSK